MNILLPLAAVVVGYLALSSSSPEPAASSDAPVGDEGFKEYERLVDVVVADPIFAAAIHESDAVNGGKTALAPVQTRDDFHALWNSISASSLVSHAVDMYAISRHVRADFGGDGVITFVARSTPQLPSRTADGLRRISELLWNRAFSRPSNKKNVDAMYRDGKDKTDRVASGMSAVETLDINSYPE